MSLVSFSLGNKNALITGGAGILGTRFSEALVEQGANLAIVDINIEAATTLAKKLSEKYSKKVIAYSCDLSQKNSVTDCVGKIVKDFGVIHVLHNNAASKSKDVAEFFKATEDFDINSWREIMAVNLDGMFLMAQAVGKHMIEKKTAGSIIQTSSIYGVVAPDQRIYEGSQYLNRQISTPAVYSASKAGVCGLTQYLACYWAPHGIRVNTLSPGGVESGQNEMFKKKYSARVPMGRMAKAEEMLGALVFLASDASSYITGQNIIIDGGLSAW